MSTLQIVALNPTEYGLDVKRASEIEAAFKPMLEKMTALESEFNRVSSLPIGRDACRDAKKLRLEYVRVRTGTAAIHKDLKAFYLAGGRFVDGWKNAQQFAAQGIEQKLEEIETHFERIEQQRIAGIAASRQGELESLGSTVIPQGLGTMDDAVWESYVTGVRVALDARVKAEKEAEEKRLAAIEAERIERERIRQENERLRAERAEIERKAAEDAAERAKVEAAERAKVEADRRAAAEVARRECEVIERKLQAEREARAKVEAAEAARVAEEKRKAAEQAEAQRKEDARLRDKQHRKRVQCEAVSAISLIAGQEIADQIISAIADGKVPHVSISY